MNSLKIAKNSKQKNIPNFIAKDDSAASHHYWREKDAREFIEIEAIIGPEVQLPNKKVLKLTKQAQLPLHPALSKQNKSAMIPPGLESASLVLLGQLAEDDCKIVLTNNQLVAIKDDRVILTGTRNRNDGLWDIPIYKNNNKNTTWKRCQKDIWTPF